MTRTGRPRIVVCVESRRKAPTYVAALRATGAEAEELVVVTADDEPESLAELTRLGAAADGLVLCGGPDLEPWRYGEEPLAGAPLSLVPLLDEIEFRLLAGARAGSTPVWALCRGLQTLNVFLGGTLFQDLPIQLGELEEHYLREPLDGVAHRIEVTDEGAAMAEALGRGPVAVNSRHHQAIKDVAPELRPVAHSRDGVLEVAEGRGGWWLRGVQWHPENLLAHEIQRRLFDLFYQAMAQRRGSAMAGGRTGAG